MPPSLLGENTFEAVAREWLAKQRIDWLRGTVRLSSPGWRRTYSRKSVHDLLPISARLNCWRRSERLRSAE